VQWLDAASRSRLFCSAISSGPLFHIPSSTHTSPLQQSYIYSSVIEWHNDQTLFSRQWKQISCPPFDPQTKAEEKPLGEWSERIYQRLHRSTSPATLSAKQILPNPENLPAEVVYQKQHHLMPHVVHVRPQSRYPRAPRDPRPTLFQHQLHPPTGRYTSAYIRKPADESDAIMFLLIQKLKT
jgi:hypothetical protein